MCHSGIVLDNDAYQLARMVAADLQKDLPNLDAHDPAVYMIPKVIDGEDSFVTYNVFKSAYWPRLTQQITNRLGGRGRELFFH